ncbi:sulfate transporter CysZ [Bermanella sp. WJH001]|uniref:sulfate transporter CysZ n=1 Tax=Bermanella sp. WJH001 TaxID=3048005 RepID=UPI0024BEBB83|nr:sulfate transporter CysZ [Bermanella sp. WJH001]MDJ1537269.1 sulfate transporter CysZ [Bermanella sp. WJH001]
MHHLYSAFRTLMNPGYRKYILIPLVANLILFVILTAILVTLFSDVINIALNYIPSWLHFMAWMFWLVFGLALLILYGLSFTFITNLIAAPFNGLLAEKIQRDHGITMPEGESMTQIIMRTLWREIVKLSYFISYGLAVALILFLISFIPFVNLIVPVLAFMWGSWCIAIQYLDYGADNYQQEFNDLKKLAKRPTFHTFSFGGTVTLLTMIPVVNIFVMPLAVAAGTRFWIKDIYPLIEQNKQIKLT